MLGAVPATPSVIEEALCAALRGESVDWLRQWPDADWPAAIERIHFHGVAGMLVGIAARDNWPAPLRDAIREEATARAMWDLRHHQLLGGLVGRLAGRGIRHAFLKGTGCAYLLYDHPDQRARADSDLLVDPANVALTRAILRDLGFAPSWGEMSDLGLAFQESWDLTHADGSRHQVDLHWQVIGARSLHNLMPVADCLAHTIAIERLANDARTLEPTRLLLHTCLHRLLHRTAPYAVAGRVYFGGERLIWAVDIQTLAASLDDEQWSAFAALATAAEVAPVCLDAFDYARKTVGVAVPPAVLDTLRAARSDSAASRHLLAFGRRRRMLHDQTAGGGVRTTLSAIRRLLFPPAEILRVHYPEAAHLPVGLLLLRRWAGFALPRRPS